MNPTSSLVVEREPAGLDQPTDQQAMWLQMCEKARAHSLAEPVLARQLHTFILQHASLGNALAWYLGHKLATPEVNDRKLFDVIVECMEESPGILRSTLLDIRAALERNPAAYDVLNVFLNQKGFQALQAYRIGHHLWNVQRHGLALFLQARVADIYAMDIHPAARIGSGVLIDHGTGVVIGETTVVGDNCTIFQDVTLGGTGKESGDRHPKVDHGSMICAGAKILGNIRIGARAKVGAASVVLTDVPAGATAVGVPATIVVHSLARQRITGGRA
jgi:serine O-acetyltransferase